MRILSGVQSNGRLHIGNYYGAIREFVRLQDEGEALYFIANLHALNSIQDGPRGRSLSVDTACAFLALGVDPARAILFRQSDVPEVTELYWILGTVVPLSNLERAHSYKDKLARGAAPNFGLFAYPLLMAADILAYDSDVVPVGRDQKQHLEFARDWATKFNMTFVPGYDPQNPSVGTGLLKLPTERIRDETAVVPGIDGQKMSKSYNNTIDLFAPDNEVKKRIMSIKTDSTPVEAPKPTDDQPLYQLLRLMIPAAEWPAVDAAWRAGGKGYGDFKKMLLVAYHSEFDAARKRYAELQADHHEVDRLLISGAEKARALAAPVLKRVRSATGL